MHVIVIGAGIVGVSIAAGLAESGTRVTVLEQGHSGEGTTSTSYAWFNANGKEPPSYFALNAAGVQAHHELVRDGAPWFFPGGHLEIAADEAHQRHLESRIARLRKHGYPVEEFDSERALQLVPDLRLPEDPRKVAFFPKEGHIFPLAYLDTMLNRARAAGAEIHTQAHVVAIEPSGAGAAVRTADGRSFEADTVVTAAGRWTEEIAALAGAHVPLAHFSEPGDATVGYLATTNPVSSSLDRVVTTPRLNVRPDSNGRLLLQALDLDAAADPNHTPPPDSALAEEYLRRLREALHGTEGAQVERLVVGQRVMPADGLTIAGPSVEQPWLYVVATHSGVTLAPLLGRAVTREVLGGHEPLLDDFRLSRFREGATLTAPPAPCRPGEQ
ncbi:MULTISPECIES: FAD-binding oxidoreductase [unclassified Actinopolyspora]|uniref:NAD(P)/FAD-dependent oxidoreductase n=1 Tax=unclassified Actinopolyspora TaxID=2639451 RepID=UPI0013F5F179|nr:MULTISPECIES: FAD-binding oxidoreductase [unclassified Actinopolyspora]NHD17763.1 FAD-binding oxidoreductase [Actinopolyspora sp. BKK2]NHE76504.1 FAD-binding oxidoreductase [Actinopolyspora sp. BKK1]